MRQEKELREEWRERKERESDLQRRGGEGRRASWGKEWDTGELSKNSSSAHTQTCCSLLPGHQRSQITQKQGVLEEVCLGLETMLLGQALTHKR